MLRLIWRNLRAHAAAGVSIVLCVALSVGACVALVFFGGGLRAGVALAGARTGAQLLVVPADAEVALSDSELLFTGAPVAAYMSSDVAYSVAGIDGVTRVTSQFYGQTISESCCATDNATRIIGFDPQSDWVISPYTDVDLSAGLTDDQVVVGSGITAFSSGSGSVLGHDFVVAAQLEPTGTYLDYSILMDTDVVRELSASQSQFAHYWEKYGDASGLISAVLVDCEEGTQASLAGKIRRALGSDYVVVSRSDTVAQAQDNLAVSVAVMGVAAAALAVVAALMLVARFYSMVWDRRSELALYRALGARTRDLRALVAGEAFALAGAGCIVGVVIGLVAYNMLYAGVSAEVTFPFKALGFGEGAAGVALVVVAFLALTLLAIIAPLMQARRVDPASAMQQLDIS